VFTSATIILQAEKKIKKETKKTKIIIFMVSVKKLSQSVLLLLVSEGLMFGTEK
jgi:hypothetical protein